jgi:hypothetical protein
MRMFCAMLVVCGCVMAVSCQATQPEPAQPPQPEYTTTATIKDIMISIVDPAGDLIWDSVSTVIDKGGIHETKPLNDADWAKVKSGAITLIEASNMLMIPGRPMARPGEKSETPGVELEPLEMEALINKDRAAWNARARALHDISAMVLPIIEAKDAQKLFDIGEDVDKACENCHRQYWYPNEKIPDFPSTPEPSAAK